jgi:hypothetical protein
MSKYLTNEKLDNILSFNTKDILKSFVYNNQIMPINEFDYMKFKQFIFMNSIKKISKFKLDVLKCFIYFKCNDIQLYYNMLKLPF